MHSDDAQQLCACARDADDVQETCPLSFLGGFKTTQCRCSTHHLVSEALLRTTGMAARNGELGDV